MMSPAPIPDDASPALLPLLRLVLALGAVLRAVPTATPPPPPTPTLTPRGRPAIADCCRTCRANGLVQRVRRAPPTAQPVRKAEQRDYVVRVVRAAERPVVFLLDDYLRRPSAARPTLLSAELLASGAVQPDALFTVNLKRRICDDLCQHHGLSNVFAGCICDGLCHMRPQIQAAGGFTILFVDGYQSFHTLTLPVLDILRALNLLARARTVELMFVVSQRGVPRGHADDIVRRVRAALPGYAVRERDDAGGIGERYGTMQFFGLRLVPDRPTARPGSPSPRAPPPPPDAAAVDDARRPSSKRARPDPDRPAARRPPSKRARPDPDRPPARRERAGVRALDLGRSAWERARAPAEARARYAAAAYRLTRNAYNCFHCDVDPVRRHRSPVRRVWIPAADPMLDALMDTVQAIARLEGGTQGAGGRSFRHWCLTQDYVYDPSRARTGYVTGLWDAGLFVHLACATARWAAAASGAAARPPVDYEAAARVVAARIAPDPALRPVWGSAVWVPVGRAAFRTLADVAALAGARPAAA
jgi:hypothetical protein